MQTIPRVRLIGLSPCFALGLATALANEAIDICSHHSSDVDLYVLAASRADAGRYIGRKLLILRTGEELPLLDGSVCGVIRETEETSMVVAAVQTALIGLAVFSRGLIVLTGEATAAEEKQNAERVSRDERRWLQHLAEGRSVSELGQLAAYSRREMHRKLSKVYEKLGASSRAEALLIALRRGYISVPRSSMLEDTDYAL